MAIFCSIGTDSRGPRSNFVAIALLFDSICVSPLEDAQITETCGIYECNGWLEFELMIATPIARELADLDAPDLGAMSEEFVH